MKALMTGDVQRTFSTHTVATALQEGDSKTDLFLL